MTTLIARESQVTPAQHQGRALILYDGTCPLCLKSVENLKRFDWFGTLAFQNARDLAALPEREPPLDPARLIQEMHLIAPDQRHVYHGFAAFRWIAWRLPLLWAFAPLLYLPGVPALGEKAYLWIARNRYRLIPCQDGACHLPPRAGSNFLPAPLGGEGGKALQSIRGLE